MSMIVTPSQTVGPYFGFALPWPAGPLVVAEGTPGAIRIHGAVYDGAGAPVDDAMIETWQADPDGRFAHPDDPRGAVTWTGFRGFGRCGTDAAGRYSILTLKPGPVPGAGAAVQAPHIDVSVFSRGLLARVATRIYFPEEEAANAADPVLSALPRGAAAETLIAVRTDDGYRFDVHLQGENETLFFAV
jgi:protocatechuate 3,4-dioxygenase, alpha subunit